jgi:hypothetical protein
MQTASIFYEMEEHLKTKFNIFIIIRLNMFLGGLSPQQEYII